MAVAGRPLTHKGEGDSRVSPDRWTAAQGSGRPPGAVPVDEGDAQLAAVLGGDDELELGDADRRAVVPGLEHAAGGERDRGKDEDVLGGRLDHGRSSSGCADPSTVGPVTSADLRPGSAGEGQRRGRAGARPPPRGGRGPGGPGGGGGGGGDGGGAGGVRPARGWLGGCGGPRSRAGGRRCTAAAAGRSSGRGR